MIEKVFFFRLFVVVSYGGAHDAPVFPWGHRKHDLGERLTGSQEVSGSIPLISTKKKPD